MLCFEKISGDRNFSTFNFAIKNLLLFAGLKPSGKFQVMLTKVCSLISSYSERRHLDRMIETSRLQTASEVLREC